MPSDSTFRQLLSRVQAPRRTTWQSLGLAVVFAVEVLIAGVILVTGYGYFNAAGYGWALVSAILVLQPGLEQSLTTALVRIAANLIGTSAGLLVGYRWGVGTKEILGAIIVVVFLCEVFRLDLGLRSACVSVIIVMTANEGKVVSSSIERGVAVVVGCVLALILQLIFERVLARLNLLPRIPDPPTPSPLKPAKPIATE
jgi:uncharacterized membrane protein YgaE (UPF0421/DUF939 family)